jgi:ATP-dependent DNA ligase
LCTTFLGGYVVTLKIEKSRIGFVEPMLALPVTKLPEGRAWSYELKFDGYRALGVKAAHR